jgi:hypothetical protein
MHARRHYLEEFAKHLREEKKIAQNQNGIRNRIIN